MSDESAFIAALAAAPEDETARLVYADWLDEEGRAEEAAQQRLMAPGYRALVGRNVRPKLRQAGDASPALYPADLSAKQKQSVTMSDVYEWWRTVATSEPENQLPNDWLEFVETPFVYSAGGKVKSKDFLSEREAWDAAARAFAKLPPDRQAELLAHVESPA